MDYDDWNDVNPDDCGLDEDTAAWQEDLSGWPSLPPAEPLPQPLL